MLSHVSAAVVHGLPVPKKSLDRVHVMRSAGNPGSKRMRTLHLHRVACEIPSVEIQGIRVTPLDRTVLDLLRTLRPTYGVAVADRSLALGLERSTLVELLDSQPRRRGNDMARRIIGFADGRSESPGESWTRWMMSVAGLPMPDLQVEFFDRAGHFVARTDFAWRERKLVGEFDGYVKYGRLLKPGQTVQDVVLAEKRREEDLRRIGLWMVRFTTDDLFRPGALSRIVQEGFAYARS